jgi:hypothetical protein
MPKDKDSVRLKFERVINLLGVLTKYTIWDFVDWAKYADISFLR